MPSGSLPACLMLRALPKEDLRAGCGSPEITDAWIKNRPRTVLRGVPRRDFISYRIGRLGCGDFSDEREVSGILWERVTADQPPAEIRQTWPLTISKASTRCIYPRS